MWYLAKSNNSDALSTRSPFKAETLGFRCSMEAKNLSTFLKFGKAKKSDICVNFAGKKTG